MAGAVTFDIRTLVQKSWFYGVVLLVESLLARLPSDLDEWAFFQHRCANLHAQHF